MMADQTSPELPVIVIGAGLAGLSCAFELAERKLPVLLLESNSILGGRTSSWTDDGMVVESGLHKYLGVYRALPELLKRAGASESNAVAWVDDLEIHDPEVGAAKFTAAPYNRPLRSVWKALTNTHFLPMVEKAKLLRMTFAGLRAVWKDPHGLDQVSLADFARRYGVDEAIVKRLLFTSTQAIFFLAADQFSAYAAFAPAAEGLKHGGTMRIGAFRGGMGDVLVKPLASAIEDKGGIIRTGVKVEDLQFDGQRVTGVVTANETLPASHVVLATPLQVAQQLIRRSLGFHPWFQPMLALQTLSAATIQFELSEPLWTSDHTHFSPTAMCCFAEQSHTTFTHVTGRLSAILYPPEDFLGLAPDETAERVYAAAAEMGIQLREKVTRYRIVNHPHDFYLLAPGTESKRPEQQTPVPGLSLAGDYTKQPLIATMEGAVISGQRAAAAITL